MMWSSKFIGITYGIYVVSQLHYAIVFSYGICPDSFSFLSLVNFISGMVKGLQHYVGLHKNYQLALQNFKEAFILTSLRLLASLLVSYVQESWEQT